MSDLPDSGYPRPDRPQNPSADRQKAFELANAFREHDLAELRRLPRSEVARQREIREDLYQYLSELYEYIRAREGVSSPSWDPGYSVVGSMKVVVEALCSNAGLVMQEADDGLGN
jgi:hypothetical protein